MVQRCQYLAYILVKIVLFLYTIFTSYVLYILRLRPSALRTQGATVTFVTRKTLSILDTQCEIEATTMAKRWLKCNYNRVSKVDISFSTLQGPHWCLRLGYRSSICRQRHNGHCARHFANVAMCIVSKGSLATTSGFLGRCTLQHQLFMMRDILSLTLCCCWRWWLMESSCSSSSPIIARTMSKEFDFWLWLHGAPPSPPFLGRYFVQ